MYALKRILLVLPTAFGVSLVAFLLAHVTPGDPAVEYYITQYDSQPTSAQLQEARQELGLDKPLRVQYLSWAGGALSGDLGTSWATGRSIEADLARRLPRTLLLALPAGAAIISIAVPLSLLAARFRNRLPDHLIRIFALAGASIPNYWLALLLVLMFAVVTPVLPASGRGGLPALILPVTALAIGPAAVLARFGRSSALEVVSNQYILVARSKGLPENQIMLRHVLRNSLIPVLTAFALSLGHLITGTVIIEAIFVWPGVGSYALKAIQARDFPAIQAVALLAGLIFTIINLGTDLLYATLDPRTNSTA